MKNISKIYEKNTLYNIKTSDISLQENLVEGNLDAELVVFYNADKDGNLNDEKRAFMLKMLGAVKHNLENTLLLSSNSNVTFKQIKNRGLANKIMFFGNTRKNVALNLNIKRYKIYKIQDIECLFIDHLGLLIDDKKRKSALWNLMKTLFKLN